MEWEEMCFVLQDITDNVWGIRGKVGRHESIDKGRQCEAFN